MLIPKPLKILAHTLCLSLLIQSAVAQNSAPLALPIYLNDQNTFLLFNEHGKFITPPKKHPWGLPVNFKDSLALSDGKTWSLVTVTGQTLRKNIDLYWIGTHWIAYTEKGKIGILNPRGQEVLPPKFDDIQFSSGENPVAAYLFKKKLGFLDRRMKIATEALYDAYRNDADYLSEVAPWIIARKNDEIWLINLDTKVQKKLTGTLGKSFTENKTLPLLLTHGDLIKVQFDGESILVNKAGDVVVPLIPYEKIPGPLAYQRMAFSTQDANGKEKCGYWDEHANIVIEPQFEKCFTFSEKGALVQTLDYAVGTIDTTGKWINAPQKIEGLYGIYEAGVDESLLEQRPVEGLALFLARKNNSYLYGMYDVNAGRILIPPQYIQLAALTKNVFKFVSPNAQKVKTSNGEKPLAGLIDRSEKILTPAEVYLDFKLDPTKQYILGFAAQTREEGVVFPRTGLLSLGGKELVPPLWQHVSVEKGQGINAFVVEQKFFAQNGEKQSYFRGLYRKDGQPIVITKKLNCNAGKYTLYIENTEGKILWPESGKPVCQ